MNAKLEDRLEWTVIFVYEFAKAYNLDMKEAINYLCQYDGIGFIDRNYEYVHIQSFKCMVNEISVYCALNGGSLQ